MYLTWKQLRLGRVERALQRIQMLARVRQSGSLRVEATGRGPRVGEPRYNPVLADSTMDASGIERAVEEADELEGATDLELDEAERTLRRSDLPRHRQPRALQF